MLRRSFAFILVAGLSSCQTEVWESVPYRRIAGMKEMTFAELKDLEHGVDFHRPILLQKINDVGVVETTFPLMKSNVYGSKGTRHLYWKVAMNGSAEVMRAISGGSLHNRAKAKMLHVISLHTLDDLDGINSQQRLEVWLAKTLNELKNREAPLLDGSIKEVYFVEFYIE